MAQTFAGLGKNIFLWEEVNGKFKKNRQVLWGDWLEIDDNRNAQRGHIPIIWAKNDPDNRMELWIPEQDTTPDRPLEIIFVDVGQGDGCVLISPERDIDERIMVIDAGEGDNMCRFLNERFKTYRGFDFHAAILTHPDKDHYLGFKDVFEDHKIGFEHLYHNGLMELPVSGSFEKVGGTQEDTTHGITYVNHLWQTHEEVKLNFSDNSSFDDFEYPPVIHAALNNPKINNISIMSTRHGTQENGRSYLHGFSPSDPVQYDIEVLGPVVEENSSGEPKLRKISSYSETKNGHSVLLRLTYGNYKIFFGGDLNKPAEEFLLRHYTGQKTLPKHQGPTYDAVVAKARERFRSEVMKTCHHGAADVTDLFLDAVNPACFVISSGDQEGHVHPRPDLLGRLGRFGRGESPVILSTELQRSTRELESQKEVEKLLELIDVLHDSPTEKRKEVIKKHIEMLARNNVDVYGAIYVKTNGERLITAFKKETLSKTNRWFYFEYTIDQLGVLEVVK